MSTDSFHHRVEQSLRTCLGVYNFSHFFSKVGEIGTPLVMDTAHFRDCPRSYGTRPKLEQVKVLKFCRGSVNLF